MVPSCKFEVIHFNLFHFTFSTLSLCWGLWEILRETATKKSPKSTLFVVWTSDSSFRLTTLDARACRMFPQEQMRRADFLNSVVLHLIRLENRRFRTPLLLWSGSNNHLLQSPHLLLTLRTLRMWSRRNRRSSNPSRFNMRSPYDHKFERNQRFY